MGMLDQDLHDKMWARNPQTVIAFFENLQALKDRRLGPALESTHQYYPSARGTPDFAQLLQQSQLVSTAADFGLNRTQEHLQASTTTAAVPEDALTQLMSEMRELKAHMATVVRDRQQPRYMPNRRMATGDITCWDCRENGHARSNCPYGRPQYNQGGRSNYNRARTPPPQQP